MRKILYLLAIIAVTGCQKNEPDLLLGKNASERIQLAEARVHECLCSFPRAEDVLLVDPRLSSLLHAEQSLQLRLRDWLPLLLLDQVEHQEVLLRLELILQAIEVNRFRARFRLPPVQTATEFLETCLCLHVFPAEVQLLCRLSLLPSLKGLHAQSFLMLFAAL